ncbi:MAG TPA: glycogen debranching enzyme N-terminal domain-containing protein, partial [Thermoanaerobaculia bacterium]|nr:glycogen debranching enzyme N-terminal domain-containing protein [Thermoanaerobaculia bacterium]
MDPASTREWLEADGLGGFASGTASGIRTRRYHALLLTAKTPPTGRFVLVNGLDAFVETSAGRFAISSQAYAPDVVHPDGASHIDRFEHEPWPRWTFTLPDGTRLSQEILVPKDASAAAIVWKLLSGVGPVLLEVRPFFSGRDYHSLHHENPAFRFEAQEAPDRTIRFQPYPDVPAVLVRTNGEFFPARDWYRRFVYAEEKARGLDFSEDLASPGVLRFDLTGEAILLLAAEGHEKVLGSGSAEAALESLRFAERARRLRFPDRLERAADAYLVRRGAGRTIVAGYPWFTDWGRDTFIALRGLCLATGRLAEAEGILVEWAGTVSEGMLPNYFTDAGAEPEFNSVDASLWYVVAVYDWLEAMAAGGRKASRESVSKL